LPQRCLVLSPATSNNLLDSNCVNGGVHKLIHGNIYVHMRLVMAARSKLRRFRPSSGYLLAMVDSYAEITATPAQYKALCIRVGDVARLWCVRSPSLNK
jgi:hypothetical protein